jgi:hypothetical protein
MTRDPDLSELDRRGSAPAPQTQRSSGFATGLAATMPFLVGLASTVIFIVGLGGESPMRFVQETGWIFYAIVAMTWLSALVLTITLVLAGRGARVPASVSLFFAGLPWVVGVAGARLSTGLVIDALQNVEPATRAMMMAQGISEASGSRLLGAWCAASLAGALALGLAISSLGQRSPNRKPLFGAVGFVLALPVLGLAGYAASSHLFGAYALYGVVAALGVLAALALGAAGAGDSLHARAAALSASVAPVALLSLLGAVAAMETGGFRDAFRAVASADPSQRALLLSAGAETFVVGGRIANLGAAALGLAALVLAGWAASRARPTLGGIGGGLALVCVAGLVVGADRAADLATEHDLGELRLTAWQGVEGFTPTTILGDSGGETDRPVAIVTVSSILPLGGEPISVATLGTESGRAALATVLRTTLAGGALGGSQLRLLVEPPPGDPPPGDDPLGLPLQDDPNKPNPRPAMTLAVDARVPASVLRIVFDAAKAAGARSIVLIGSGMETRPGAMERLQEEAPLVAYIAQRTGSVMVLLESALPPLYADTDPTLWHATVTSTPRAELLARAGSVHPPRTLSGEGESYGQRFGGGDDEEPRAVAYLTLADDATTGSLAALALAARREELQALVVTGPMPGHPEAPGTDLLHLDGGSNPLGLGMLGLGGQGDSASVRAGISEVLGSLPPAVIQRIVRRHMGEVRACYERGLIERPTLNGRVEVRFVISPTGAVQTATVGSSDLGAPAVEQCITTAVQGWTFPEPEGGGVVSVMYPFVLMTNDDP